MTFLELCQHVHRLIRPGPELPGSVPSATTGQTGILGEIVYWTNKAWTDIQSEESEWTWMTLQGTISVTLAGGRTYAFSTTSTSTIPTFTDSGASTAAYAERVQPMCPGRYNKPHGVIYLTATGVSDSTPCWFVPYEDWRGMFDRGTRPDGKPNYFTALPGGKLQFDPTPDATYTFVCDFRVMPQSLSATADTPLNWPVASRGLPNHYHDVIAWRAVKLYALTRQEASALYQMAEREERRYLEKMRREFTPSIDLDDSLFDY